MLVNLADGPRRRFPTRSKSERHFARFLPTGRKEGKNSVDKAGGLWIRLVRKGRGGTRSPHRVAGGEDECPDRCRKHRTNHPTQGDVRWSRRRENRGVGSGYGKKMLIIDERSRNVYENKQKDDTFTEIKSDISTQLNDILYRRTPVLQRSSALLSRFARWGRYPSLPFVEAPVTCRMPPGVWCPVALAPSRTPISLHLSWPRRG